MTNSKTIGTVSKNAENEPKLVMGHDIGGARLTPVGVFWLLVYLGLPVLVLGNLLDLLVQWGLGWCVGLWCIASR
jgi:hypothetical protein